MNKKIKSLHYIADPISQKNVDHAWDQFLCKKGDVADLPVRNLIVNSWERCLSQGVDPGRKAAPLLVSDDALYSLRQQNNELMQCALPVLEEARVLLHELESVLFITDYEGVNLEIVGDPRTIDDAHFIGLVPGGGWKEVVSGSNAVGTALATEKPVQVHGEEHYCQGFKPWTCTAAVISDPYDNQMIGVIDLSGLSNIYDRFHLPMIVSWATQIQTSLANVALMQWSHIRDLCTADTHKYSNSGNLLFDKQGRLINHSQNTNFALRSLGIGYDPATKRRLSFERFGGDKIIYPHDKGQWISGDWVEPIKKNDEILGFQLHVPTHKSVNRLHQKTSGLSGIADSDSDPFNEMYGTSASFIASTDKARKAATTPLPVLIQGDTGVGKEVFAQAIHKSSNYAKGPFIDLNCGAFAKEILSSELFGHVEGAFTGAKKGGMKGKIEAANGGTLFLDEIGEMPLEIQPVFLRVLQERKIYRVGAVKPVSVDFRLIAATNCDLKRCVAEGTFRKDLYFRLSTITISLDPLSGRHEDIEGIANLVLERTGKSHSIIPRYFSPSLLSALKNREWPGNIRELVNVVECMCFMSQNETLTVDDLPDGYREDQDSPFSDAEETASDSSFQNASLDFAEKQTIENAIKQCDGNMTRAAKNLGIAKGTLYRKVKKYGLEK